MPLPRCGNEERAAIHKLANAYALHSKSQGSGHKRFTTLSKRQTNGRFATYNPKRAESVLWQLIHKEDRAAGRHSSPRGNQPKEKAPNSSMLLLVV
jgi:hypothetical protein